MKAFAELLDTLGRDAKALGRGVCFIQTGGVFGQFPFRDRVTRLVAGAARPRL